MVMELRWPECSPSDLSWQSRRSFRIGTLSTIVSAHVSSHDFAQTQPTLSVSRGPIHLHTSPLSCWQLLKMSLSPCLDLYFPFSA